MPVNSRMPFSSRVSRNASAIRIGAKVPNALMPTTLRSSTMISAPSGMVSTTRYTICICTGRLSSENCNAIEPRSAARWRAAASAS
jgi:hypothetical protein